MMKLIIFFLATLVLSMACNATTIALVDSNEPFTLKKNESKQIGNFKVKMLSVGHTFGEKGGYVYANLEITDKAKPANVTLRIGKTTPLGDKFLKLVAVNEKADPKLSDPFAATSCTLSVENQSGETPIATASPAATPTATPSSTPTKIKPTFSAGKTTKVKLGLGKKTVTVDLGENALITLGGEEPHRYKLHFATVKADKVYYLFEVQSGSAMSNPLGYCGGDSPQTLVWLKTDFNLTVEDQNSEVFASCAYNGGRYLQGKINKTAAKLNLVFEQQKTKYEITYDNSMPENGFEVKKQ